MLRNKVVTVLQIFFIANIDKKKKFKNFKHLNFEFPGLLAYGVKESSNVNGIFTIVNLITVTIVIVCGLFKGKSFYFKNISV